MALSARENLSASASCEISWHTPNGIAGTFFFFFFFFFGVTSGLREYFSWAGFFFDCSPPRGLAVSAVPVIFSNNQAINFDDACPPCTCAIVSHTLLLILIGVWIFAAIGSSEMLGASIKSGGEIELPVHRHPRSPNGSSHSVLMQSSPTLPPPHPGSPQRVRSGSDARYPFSGEPGDPQHQPGLHRRRPSEQSSGGIAGLTSESGGGESVGSGFEAVMNRTTLLEESMVIGSQDSVAAMATRIRQEQASRSPLQAPLSLQVSRGCARLVIGAALVDRGWRACTEFRVYWRAMARMHEIPRVMCRLRVNRGRVSNRLGIYPGIGLPLEILLALASWRRPLWFNS